MAVELQAETIETPSAFVERGDLERMRAVPNSRLPGYLRTGAVTIGYRVFMRTGRFDEETPCGLALIAHESRHVGQYRKMGIPLFLLRYMVGNVTSGFSHDKHPMEADLVKEQAEIRAALEAR